MPIMRNVASFSKSLNPVHRALRSWIDGLLFAYQKASSSPESKLNGFSGPYKASVPARVNVLRIHADRSTKVFPHLLILNSSRKGSTSVSRVLIRVSSRGLVARICHLVLWLSGMRLLSPSSPSHVSCHYCHCVSIGLEEPRCHGSNQGIEGTSICTLLDCCN